ncbi:MAG: SH3 domain-containing protein [Clostridiales bacterium]|nr:SH3 domain-containing protein [Clostridiales bacterium]
MKKIFKLFITSLLVISMTTITSFAAEKQETSSNIPAQIEVEGGKLILVNTESDLSMTKGIARYQYHVITDGSNLNVRSGPGTNYSIIGQFKNGQVIDVSFTQESGIAPWVYAGGIDAVTGNYINGYIHSNYYG